MKRPFQTRFRFGSVSLPLNLAGYIHSPDHSTKGTTSHIDVLCVLVSTRFQVLFTPRQGSFSPFLHSTTPLSVTREYLGLEDGPPIFPPGFTCPAVLWIQLADFSFRIRDYHSLWWTVPCPSANLCQCRILSEPRKYYYSRFGLFRVRSPLLAESRLISFHRPT